MPEKNDKKAYKGWRGTIRAALIHHPDKFSKEACKSKKRTGKLCPYAVFTAMKKKGDESHYKELPHTTKGMPEKKEKYKNKVMSFKEYVEKRDMLEESKKKKKVSTVGMLNSTGYM